MKPTITSNCIENQRSGPGETIAEVRFPTGERCWISARQVLGCHTIEIMRADPSIKIITPEEED